MTLGHHLLAHAWACSRDLDRFAQWADRASTSALGAGATATSTLGLDPAATAERLGLRRAFANSIDAVSDRDFVQEFLAVASIDRATHLSRLAADLARWTDESLGLGRARRGLLDGFEHDAAEAEPRYGRTRRAGRRREWRGTSWR